MEKVNTIKTKSLQCEYPYSKHAFPKEEATENAITSASTDEMMELDEPASDVEEDNPKEVDEQEEGENEDEHHEDKDELDIDKEDVTEQDTEEKNEEDIR
ncbi:hypothetical protein [Parasitella parasitica]|uniref:Uncharacterized protein n=1 Tax=Parasitella parasitica TaxID=35722 RepID=A0A0B7MV22_9FUNG|nr:hypothetical protein [Parasitella parasitica]